MTLRVDNSLRRAGPLAEHGLVYWIGNGSHRVLFVTGPGPALVPNVNLKGVT